MIEFRCPDCSSEMSAPVDRAGQVESCPSCGRRVIVPPPGGAEAAVIIKWPPSAGSGIVFIGVLVMVVGVLMFGGGLGGPSAGGLEVSICGSIFAVGGLLAIGLGRLIGCVCRLGAMLSNRR